MVNAGMAWAYRQYLVDRSLIELEAQARQSRRGLWADPEPAAPLGMARGSPVELATPTSAHRRQQLANGGRGGGAADWRGCGLAPLQSVLAQHAHDIICHGFEQAHFSLVE